MARGWYLDPSHPLRHRFWTGTRWSPGAQETSASAHGGSAASTGLIDEGSDGEECP
ncbi:DUF2510 domain-containing protein [Nocardioides scoriae]|uniref:DUF2510 domain-containing protein n=1 Tax=Nocardioides scoriae TaxID=642780 RepID=UPI0038B2A301